MSYPSGSALFAVRPSRTCVSEMFEIDGERDPIAFKCQKVIGGTRFVQFEDDTYGMMNSIADLYFVTEGDEMFIFKLTDEDYKAREMTHEECTKAKIFLDRVHDYYIENEISVGPACTWWEDLEVLA